MSSPTELEQRYDPMSRDELIAECEKLRGLLREVRDAVRSVDLINARDAAGNFTELGSRIDAELTAHTSTENAP